MSKNKHTTVIGQVFKVLDNKVELGGLTEQNSIQRMSEFNIDSFTTEFRANYAHLINYPFKDSTVNRAVEKWLKARQ